MDDLSDFFDFSKPFERKTIAGGVNDGRIKTKSSKIKFGGEFQQRTNVEKGAQYARKYERQDEKLAKVSKIEFTENKCYVIFFNLM